MSNIQIETKVTINIDGKTFEMTRAEAMSLYNALRQELGIQAPIYNPWDRLIGAPNHIGPLVNGPVVPYTTPHVGTPFGPGVTTC